MQRLNPMSLQPISVFHAFGANGAAMTSAGRRGGFFYQGHAAVRARLQFALWPVEGSIPISRISAPSCSISPRLFARSKSPSGRLFHSPRSSVCLLRVVVKAVKMQGSLQDRIGIFLRVR